jgi:tRNA dimethylallyltransferase
MRPGMLPKLTFIVGPTASGKSALAMGIAEKLGNAEIISIDSAQVYQEMNIGTAKPTRAERAAVPHHVIDTISPEQSWSVTQYCTAFNAALDDITARNKTPLVAGGTMMYVSALLTGLSEIPAAQITMREAISSEAAEHGWPHLHSELARVDPATAARLPLTDAQRISRALEVFRATGQPLSSFQGARAPLLKTHTPQLIVLEPADRAGLHTRIGARFDAMIREGLIEEVEDLRRRYQLTAQLPSMRCVGYRQVWDFLDGSITKAQMIEQGIAATRQLAKRQLTWQRNQFAGFTPQVVDPFAPDAMKAAIARYTAPLKT